VNIFYTLKIFVTLNMGVVFWKYAHFSSLGALTGNVIPVGIPVDPNMKIRTRKFGALGMAQNKLARKIISVVAVVHLNTIA
jgi:hypothetical protein